MIVTEQEASFIRCQESYGTFYVTRDGHETHMPPPLVSHAVGFIGPGGGGGAGGGAAVPMAVSSTPAHPFPTTASPSHCIGARCMAWCWVLGDGWQESPVGYCGKAGK